MLKPRVSFPVQKRGAIILMELSILMTVFYGCNRDSTPEPQVAVDPFMWKSAWDEASESQREALRDGKLTFEEYEAAAFRAVQCVNESGEMQGEAKLDGGTYSVGARWKSNGDRTRNERLRSESDACYREHWSGINQAWSAMNQPTETQLIAARAALAQCLREAGFELPDSPSTEDVQRHQSAEAFPRCLEKVQAESGIPNFGG
jgi:hypothetical protein